MSAPIGAAPERIWLAVEAVDMRLGIDGLSARIQASLGRTFPESSRQVSD